MTPLWLPIVTGLIAACSALAGVILNNHLARRDRLLEHSLRAAQQARDFLIDKGEDLYVHLDMLDSYVSEHCRHIQALCSSEIDRDAFLALRREGLDARDKFSVARIRLSIRSFFPALIADYADLAENLARIDVLDRALLHPREPDASLFVKANADSLRLEKLVATRGEQLRAKLEAVLADVFILRENLLTK